MEKPEDNCPVCHEAVTVYAIGECDHPICYRCSIRMRALCGQMYCPICRGDLTQVYMLSEMKKDADIPRHGFFADRKIMIFMENNMIKQKIDKLIEHRCPKCKHQGPFRYFRDLQTHMRKEHTLFYCELCVENLKIFTSERKHYSRQDLATHRRLGDKNDSAYKGHPLCKFCDERYMDNDELFRHLRKDHYYCHYCESEGSQDFYSDYEELRDHFKSEHYLCEEGECSSPHTQFTHAFRSRIDLKAHVTSVHQKNMSKSQVRQARNIDIEINLAPRSQRGRGDRGAGSGRQDYKRGQRPSHRDRFSEEELGRAIQSSLVSMKDDTKKRKKEEKVKEEEVKEDPPESPKVHHDENNFPLLGAESNGAITSGRTSPPDGNLGMANHLALANNMSVQHGKLRTEDFPSLGNDSSAKHISPIPAGFGRPQSASSVGSRPKQPAKTSVSSTGAKSTNTSSVKKMTHSIRSVVDDFPELPTSKPKHTEPTPNVTLWKPSDFPVSKAESSSSQNSLENIGFSVTKTSNKQNNNKRQFNPTPTKTTLSDNKEFPTLGSASNEGKSLLDWGSKVKTTKDNNKNKISKDWFDHVDEEFSSDKFKGDKDSKTLVIDTHKNSKKKKDKDKKKPTVKVEQITTSTDYSLDNIASSLLSTSTATATKGETIASSSSARIDKKSESSKKRNEEVLTNKQLSNKSAAKHFDTSKGSFESSEYPSLGNDPSPSIPQSNSKPQSSETKKIIDSKPVVTKTQEVDTSKKYIPPFKKAEKAIKEVNLEQHADENAFSVLEDNAAEFTVKQSSRQFGKPQKNKNKPFVEGDFPSLGSGKKNPPPGFAAPAAATAPKKPPGFTDNSLSAHRPPPGFSTSSPTGADLNDTLKKAGLKDIVPMSNSSENFVYAQTENFQTRNKELIMAIRDLVSDDQERFGLFKTSAGSFRNDLMSAAEYYDKCEVLLGKEGFNKIFPELLSLLPDIGKQQELLKAYSEKEKTKNSKSSKKGSGKGAWNAESATQFRVCSTCRQVLSEKDFQHHMSIHSADGDFPSLETQNPTGLGGTGFLRDWVRAK